MQCVSYKIKNLERHCISENICFTEQNADMLISIQVLCKLFCNLRVIWYIKMKCSKPGSIGHIRDRIESVTLIEIIDLGIKCSLFISSFGSWTLYWYICVYTSLLQQWNRFWNVFRFGDCLDNYYTNESLYDVFRLLTG